MNDELEDVVAGSRRADAEDVHSPRVGRDECKRPTDPEWVRDPVEDRGDARMQPPEGHLRPLVRPTFLRERRPDLGHEQHVRSDEDDGEDDKPEEALRAVVRNLSERVEPDEGADREEHHVETAKRLDQLRLLLDGENGRVLYRLICNHASLNLPAVADTTSRHICAWTSRNRKPQPRPRQAIRAQEEIARSDH